MTSPSLMVTEGIGSPLGLPTITFVSCKVVRAVGSSAVKVRVARTPSWVVLPPPSIALANLASVMLVIL